MDKKMKQTIGIVAIGVTLFVALMHLDVVFKGIGYVGGMITPVLIGLIMAFVLNVPVTGFEKRIDRLFAKRKRKPGKSAVHMTSIVLTLVCVALVLVILGTLVIPELVNTVKSIIGLVEENWPTWLATLEDLDINTTGIQEWAVSLDIENLFKKVSGHAGTVIGSIADAATSTVSSVATGVTGLIIALYVMGGRDTLARQTKNVLYAYVKEPIADRLCHVGALIKESYTKFLTGQCVEAVILGVLIFLGFTIFKLPYAGLIGAVTAICALIPYIGAFISCVLSVILALMVSPQKALMCLIVYLAIQFIETQFIYPHVVGGSVGLSPLWTLIAVLIGGNLFGIVGMIFFIPLVSVIYTLFREDVHLRLKKKTERKKQVSGEPSQDAGGTAS